MVKNIEAILFDVGGTLRRTTHRTPDEKNALVSSIMEIVGAQGDPHLFSRELNRRYRAYQAWARETMEELGEGDLWTRWILPDSPAPLVQDNAIRLNQLFRESLGVRTVDPLTREVVIELFRRGYRLGIVSNTTSSVEVPALLKELGIPGCFETVILSAVVGRRKPDPAILLDAASRMGVKPGHCAYIGDRPDRDVAAGQAAGFALTILIQREQGEPGTSSQLEFTPDTSIQSLGSLLEIFPPRQASLPMLGTPMYDVAFSTMWVRKNFPGLGDFMEAARRIGFARIELNHQMNSETLAEADLTRVKISSIHEPCPADIPLDTLKERDWLVSALDEENRIHGVEAVKRSILLAEQVGADYIVVHAGANNSSRNLERKLRLLVEHGQAGTDEFYALVEEMKAERQEKASRHFAAVRKSIRELLDFAAPRRVRLGIENRYHFLEIPSPDELQTLLEMGGPEQIGFVLDTGHAYALDRMGFYPFTGWLERFSNRIIGTHLHDVVGLTDHYAPGRGEIDFDLVGSYLPPEANRTCEFQVFNTFEQVKNGLNYLHDHHCIRLMDIKIGEEPC